ncbi:uncharacterized protein [Littorina saxatilis]|uniref:uncharacterized protein n=1 Tax=Littorina saxatilis TaxID=31220 RepID=UPI0038B42D26
MTGCIIYVDGKECYRFGYTEPETSLTEPSRTTNVTCVTGVLNGRNVTLAKNTTGFTGDNITINMCELQVLSCSDDYWGSGCDRRCGNCSNSEVCDKVTGHCSSCPPGLQPPLCDREEHTGGEPISTGMLVGAGVGSLSAVVVLLIVVLVAVRWQRSRSHQTNEGRATDIASYDARIDSSKIISPTNHRNPVILSSSQSDNNYEAVDGEVNHGYVNSEQDMPATTQNPAERFPATTEVCVVEGESNIGAPRKSSAPSTDQPYENVDRGRENTYERPQVYVNTGDQHVYSELKT